jgi:hypothetical protein
MGGLFSGKHHALPDLNIDLEAVEPTDDTERRVFDDFNSSVLADAESICTRFSGYQDCQGLVAASIVSPTEEAKTAAWEAAVPCVQLQMDVRAFGAKIVEFFGRLVHIVIDLIKDDSGPDLLKKIPTIIRCFATTFDIIITLDEIKLGIPKLLNDLAFFRRNAPHYNNDGSFDKVMEQSNETTMFWASSTPMLSAVITSMSKDFPASSPSFQKVLGLLGGVSDICTGILKHHPGESEKKDKLCLRCIVGATLIFDHLSPTGAFGTKPAFHIKEAMEILVHYTPKQTGLINAVKFSSKHLGDAAANPAIKALFA